MISSELKYSILLLTLFVILGNGCTSRYNTPELQDDQTKIYPAKDPEAVTAKITFYKKSDKKTGILIGKGTDFIMREKGWIRAGISLNNLFVKNTNPEMFHVNWIGPNGRMVYRKRIDVAPGDSTHTFSSSIAGSPEKREPGKYLLRLYYFRELIAEKEFELIPESEEVPRTVDGISGSVTLCRKYSKKSGKRIGIDFVFVIKKKARVRAFIDLEGRFVNENLELVFHVDWIGPDGKSFYRKKIEMPPDDSSTVFRSSVSITPEKRQPGDYQLRVFLFNELLAEKQFKLQEEK
ncbi:MAG: hypothetical protein K8R53_00935 [Bacteroidales bacterium]|nr:hypothetical protein [Bacteroidales bacterium]